MSESFADLRALPDDELVKRHDQRAKSTVVGTGAYLEELNRRQQHHLVKRTTEAAEVQAMHASTMAKMSEVQAAFLSKVASYLEDVAEQIRQGAEQNAEMVRQTITMRRLAWAGFAVAIAALLVAAFAAFTAAGQ